MPRDFNPNKPRCYLVYALAPETIPMRDADRAFNEFIGHPEYGLVLYHDHFDRVGGFAVFFLENEKQLNALAIAPEMQEWKINVHPLTFSDSGAGFLAQIEFTLKTYRNTRMGDLVKVGKSTWAEPAKG